MARKQKSSGLPTRQQILDFIAASDQPAGKREIARAFGLKGQDRVALKPLLRDMADEGLIDSAPGRAFHRIGGVPKVTVLRVADIDDSGRVWAVPERWEAEGEPPRLRVMERKGRGAALGVGDRILSRTEERGDPGSGSGAGGWIAHPMKKLLKGSELVLGVVHKEGTNYWLRPVEKKERRELPIAELGDAGPGDLVLAEKVGRPPRLAARVDTRLGDPFAPRSFSLIAIHKHGIPHEFPDAVLEEAERAARLAILPGTGRGTARSAVEGAQHLAQPPLPRLPSAAGPPPRSGEEREDLTHLPIVAIDPADARDHDDAVWAAPDDDPKNPGGWQAIVAIADVSYYVRPGSALDKEARKRGNSVYFPDRVVPMLPETLSAGICSLRQGEDRAALVCRLQIANDGQLKSWRFERARVRIAANIPYEDAQAAMDLILPGTGRGTATRSGVVEGAQRRNGGESGPLHHASHVLQRDRVPRTRSWTAGGSPKLQHPPRPEEDREEGPIELASSPCSFSEADMNAPEPPVSPELVETVLKPLWACWRALNAARAKRAPLELELPERRVMLDEKGRIMSVAPRERLDAHKLIEDYMIAANVAAAKALEAKKAPVMYRVHEPPGREKLVALKDYLKTFGIEFALGQVIRPATFNRLIEQARGIASPLPAREGAGVGASGASERRGSEGRPRRHPPPAPALQGGESGEEPGILPQIMEQVLRTQTQAYYAPDNRGHFGLALGSYAHFTSPIRRYADLVVHRSLVRAGRLGEGGLTDQEAGAMEVTGELISNLERRAMVAERETLDRYVAAYLADHVGERVRCRITGVQPFGFFATVEELGGDGLVPVASLTHDYFRYDEASQTLTGDETGERFSPGQRLTLRLAEADPVSGALRFALPDAAKVAARPRPARGERGGERKPGRRGRPAGIRHQGRKG